MERFIKNVIFANLNIKDSAIDSLFHKMYENQIQMGIQEVLWLHKKERNRFTKEG